MTDQKLGEYREGYYTHEMIQAMVSEAFARGRANAVVIGPDEAEIEAASGRYFIAQECDCVADVHFIAGARWYREQTRAVVLPEALDESLGRFNQGYNAALDDIAKKLEGK